MPLRIEFSSQYIQLGLELGIPFDRIAQIRIHQQKNPLEIVRPTSSWMVLEESGLEGKQQLVGLPTALLNAGCDIKALMEYQAA